jgi:hypothetical protein
VEERLTFRNSSLAISLCDVDLIYCHWTLGSGLRTSEKPKIFLFTKGSVKDMGLIRPSTQRLLGTLSPESQISVVKANQLYSEPKTKMYRSTHQIPYKPSRRVKRQLHSFPDSYPNGNCQHETVTFLSWQLSEWYLPTRGGKVSGSATVCWVVHTLYCSLQKNAENFFGFSISSTLSVDCLLVCFNAANKTTLLCILIYNNFLKIEDGYSKDRQHETLLLIPLILK